MIEEMIVERLAEAIRSAETIALISHVRPDGDTCGSASALYRALCVLGKDARLFCDSEITAKLKSLRYSDQYNLPCDVKKFDLAIAVDCADEGRLGNYSTLFRRAKKNAVVDHHASNTGFGDINLIEPTASATAEVIYRILTCLGQNCLDAEVAQLLFTAIVTDSGGFSFSSVGVRTHEIAARLLAYGFDASRIIEYFLRVVTPDVFRLKNRVLSKTQFFEDGQIALILFECEDFEATGTSESDTEGIINDVRYIDGVRAAVSVTELKSENNFKVSLRSDDSVNAAEIAATFGGGGHKNAAGCRVNGLKYDVLEKIVRAVKLCL